MDNNKLKFLDRMKILIKPEVRKDVDPYVFSEVEPVISTGSGKNIKLIAPKNLVNSPQNCKLIPKHKKKCLKQTEKSTEFPLGVGFNTNVNINPDKNKSKGK